MKTKRIQKPKLTFTFTVAWWRGQFAPPAAPGRPKHSGKFSLTICEEWKKFWRYLPLTRSFQVCHQKIFLSLLYYIILEFNSFQLSFGCVHTSGVKRPELRSATFISECRKWWVVAYKCKRRCPTELGTYEISTIYLRSTHVHASFASVENSVMSVTKNSFEEKAATVFEK